MPTYHKSVQALVQDSAAQPTQQSCDHVVGLDCDPGGYNADLRTMDATPSSFEGERDWAVQFNFCPYCGESLKLWWKLYRAARWVPPGPAEQE